MTRTVSAKTDPALEQSEDASAAGSLTSPALTRASSVPGLSLIAAHPNRVVSPAPSVTASCASVTRMRPRNRKGSQLNPTLPGSPFQNDSGRPDCSFDSKGAGPVAQPRRQSTNSRMSVGGAPNLDIQRVRGLSQVHLSLSRATCLQDTFFQNQCSHQMPFQNTMGVVCANTVCGNMMRVNLPQITLSPTFSAHIGMIAGRQPH